MITFNTTITIVCSTVVAFNRPCLHPFPFQIRDLGIIPSQTRAKPNFNVTWSHAR